MAGLNRLITEVRTLMNTAMILKPSDLVLTGPGGSVDEEL